MDESELADSKSVPFDWSVIPVSMLIAAEGIAVSLHDGIKILRTATVAHLSHRLEGAAMRREMSLWLETMDVDIEDLGY